MSVDRRDERVSGIKWSSAKSDYGEIFGDTNEGKREKKTVTGLEMSPVVRGGTKVRGGTEITNSLSHSDWLTILATLKSCKVPKAPRA